MESARLPAAGRPSELAPSFRTEVVLFTPAAFALGLGIHVGVWVNTARAEDDSILFLIPWLAYPGVVAALAVRSGVEKLAIGLAVAIPVATFAVIYGAERVRDMGGGVFLGYATFLLMSIGVASRFARRPGPQWFIGAIVGGGAAFLLLLALTFIVLSLQIY